MIKYFGLLQHKYSVDDYSSIRRSESDQDNEILGSGKLSMTSCLIDLNPSNILTGKLNVNPSQNQGTRNKPSDGHLISGNFLVIKGGTFYGTERSYLHKKWVLSNKVLISKVFLNLYSYGYPKNYGNYYGGNQFQNFRDFADLKKQKGDRRRFY